MQGRVVIYDYDQSMLVWRGDLPNPSHQVLQAEIKEYARLGILGFGTESRNALATTFLNLYFRGQLYWNPQLDVQAELRAGLSPFFRTGRLPYGSLLERHLSGLGRNRRDRARVFCDSRHLSARVGGTLGKLAAPDGRRAAATLPRAAGLVDPAGAFWMAIPGCWRGLLRVTIAAAVKAGEEALVIREQLAASQRDIHHL